MKKYIILIPLYNDWKSVFKLLENIDTNISDQNIEVSIFIVNDASTEKRPAAKFNFKKIQSLRVLNMKQNRGHARCYATGLKYLIEKEKFDYIIQMDADGEDRPEELSALFDKSKKNPLKTITLNRTKRSEGPFFKFLYECHKILTYIFTGKLIKFGNYSCLPRNDVIKLIKEASIWSSFSGSATKVISDKISIPSTRGKRYFGPSQMNIFSLLVHSFSIIAVFKRTVIVRSIFSISIYLFFTSSNFSFITLLPVLVVSTFLILILKISLRANIYELNNSLENILNIDVLSDSNSR
jgi:hypothetical protein